jgi:hypothetical protein
MERDRNRPEAHGRRESDMTQSRRSSLAEAMIGTAIGFLFTVASIVRSYAVRRLFNRLALMRNSQRDLGSVL